jgi:2-hydroxyacyl-CoA lyase 1
MEAGGHPDKLRGFDKEQRSQLREVLAKRKRTGDQLIAKGLLNLGIKRLYTLSGNPIEGILKAAATNGIELIGTRMQFGACVMSAVDNFVSGGLISAVCVSSGPAVTNCATGVHNAEANQRPLLLLGSRRGFPGEEGAFQGARLVEMMEPVTKWSAEVTSVEDIVPMIETAGRIAMEGAPGPVYLEFPEQLFTARGFEPITREPGNTDRKDSREAVCFEQPARMMETAQRPLLCLTEDLRWNWDADAVRELVEHHQLPFITTPMGRGTLPDEHPLCLNAFRRRVLQRTDLLVMIGGALDWRFRFGKDLSAECRFIQAGRDPDQLGMNRPADWQACMEPIESVKGLSQRLTNSLNSMVGWREEIDSFGEHLGKPYDRDYINPPGFADPTVFLSGLRERLPDSVILVVDGGICLSMANHFLRAKQPFSWFDAGFNGCIGSGIPQAVGAKLAEPERPIVAIIGDSGFGMSSIELETAARYGIAIKVVVFNNSGINGAHRDRQIFGDEKGRSIARFQPGLRYDLVAKGLGVESGCSDNADTAVEHFMEMLDVEGPACLNLLVDPDFPIPDIW